MKWKSAFPGGVIAEIVSGTVAALRTWKTFSGVVVLMISLPKSNELVWLANPFRFVVMITGPGMPVPDRLSKSCPLLTPV